MKRKKKKGEREEGRKGEMKNRTHIALLESKLFVSKKHNHC